MKYPKKLSDYRTEICSQIQQNSRAGILSKWCELSVKMLKCLKELQNLHDANFEKGSSELKKLQSWSRELQKRVKKGVVKVAHPFIFQTWKCTPNMPKDRTAIL